MTKNGFIAGTILVTNQNGESFFLVQEMEEKSNFCFEAIEENVHFPMGVIMRSLLKKIQVDSESLRIVDTTTITDGEWSIPLFVFDLTIRPIDPNELVLPGQKVSWRRSKELGELLSNAAFTGVPVYRSVTN